MKQYKHRIADILLRDRLEEVGAVLIEGPKWCGKTTTAEQQAKRQFDKKNYWLAIPQSELNKNKNLVQNPGY